MTTGSGDPRHKALQDWAEADLQSLVEAGVAEQRDIEYKRAVPGRTDKDKREVAGDLSSFGNATGGWLIYGVAAKDGIPQQVVGLQDSADPFILWLDQVAQSVVEPRLPGLRVQSISTSGGNHCVVVRVPISWNKPHAVKRCSEVLLPQLGRQVSA